MPPFRHILAAAALMAGLALVVGGLVTAPHTCPPTLSIGGLHLAGCAPASHRDRP